MSAVTALLAGCAVADAAAAAGVWPWLVFTLRQDDRRLHGLHGRRRAAHAGRAQDLGVDPGPARSEPRRAHGLLQPVADGVKNFMKEETYPGGGEQAAVHPRAGARVHSRADHVGGDSVRRAVGVAVGPHRDGARADLPVGFLFILAISSLGVYGIVLAGWASNNKYALLGGLRSSAQMVSYEIAMGMSHDPGAAAGRQRRR